MRRFVQSVFSGLAGLRADRGIALAFLSVALSFALSPEVHGVSAVQYDNSTDLNATITETTSTVFGGSGLNDATFSGYLTGPAATFTVQINGTGTPDTFQWKKGTGAFSASINCSASPQLLSDGISVVFGATTGHTLNASWTFTANALTATVTGFTVGNHPNRFLLAAVSISTGDFHVSTFSGNGVTTTSGLGGVSLDNQHATESGGTNKTRSEHWATTPGSFPSVGTGDITFTFVRDSGTATSFEATIGIVSLWNVNQTTPIYATTGQVTSTTASLNSNAFFSTTGMAVVVSLACRPGAGTIGEWTAGQTPRWNSASGSLIANGSTIPGSTTLIVGYTLATAQDAVASSTVIQPQTDTLVRLDSLNAFQTSAGVGLRWRSGHEASNLGFNVYREENGVQTRVNRSLISGSALLVGPQTELTQGRGYRWTDPTPADSSVRYWLESIDLNGETTLHGPVFVPSGIQQEEPGTGFVTRTALLETLGRDAGVETGQPGIPVADEAIAPAGGTTRIPIFASASPSSGIAATTQRGLAAGAAAKIGVTQEGWYSVTRDALVAAGFDPGTDLARLQLFVEGLEIPILVRTTGSGAATSLASIEFYGTPIDTPYGGKRIYWLVRGNSFGQRVGAADQKKANGLLPASFPFAVERKDRTVYFAALTNNGDASNFFGPVVSPTNQEQLHTVAPHDKNSAATWPLSVTLQGVTYPAQHVVDVLVNGTKVGTASFQDQARSTATLQVPSSILAEGTNTVSLVARGGSSDVSLIDTVRLTYPHTFGADAGALKLTAASSLPVAITGFPDASVRILDVTDPRDVSELSVKVSGAAGSFNATTVVPKSGKSDRTLLAITSSRVLAPASITANVPSSLQSDTGRVDLVIVSNGAFLGAATTLKSWREAQGFAVKLVDVEDIYDEYNFGHKSPYAIQSYLQSRGVLGAKYALFLGDSTIDPRNYLGLGDFDLVPTKLVATHSLKTASDDWFVDFAGTGLPQMAVGRLSVRTPTEAATVVSKLKAYDQSLSSTDAWRKTVVQVADQDDPPAANTFSFESEVGTLTTAVPAGLSVQNVFAGQVGGTAAHDSIVSKLNGGAMLTTFVGHGTQDTWSKLHIFDSVDSAALTNGSKLPVVISMNCLNGLFIDVYADSLAEVLQKQPNGGAAAVWASSSLTPPEPQGLMVGALYQALFSSTSVRLGDAMNTAKAATTDLDVRRSWILFGDPMMKLR